MGCLSEGIAICAPTIAGRLLCFPWNGPSRGLTGAEQCHRVPAHWNVEDGKAVQLHGPAVAELGGRLSLLTGTRDCIPKGRSRRPQRIGSQETSPTVTRPGLLARTAERYIRSGSQRQGRQPGDQRPRLQSAVIDSAESEGCTAFEPAKNGSRRTTVWATPVEYGQMLRSRGARRALRWRTAHQAWLALRLQTRASDPFRTESTEGRSSPTHSPTEHPFESVQ